jgi:hypothetical protein
MVEMTNNEIQRSFNVLEGEVIKLDIGGVKYLEETVQAGYQGIIIIKYQENKI